MTSSPASEPIRESSPQRGGHRDRHKDDRLLDRPSETPEEAGSFSLRHLSGRRLGDEDRFERRRVAIGRGQMNHCVFHPELDRSVSGRHCEIRQEDDAFVLYDVGSLNGTFVNGRRTRRTELHDGDEIGLGREGPRLRFLRHSGHTPAPLLPGDLPLEKPRRASKRMSLPWRKAIFALAILGALTSIGLLWYWSQDPGSNPQKSNTRNPAGEPPHHGRTPHPGTAIPDGPRGTTVLILGVLHDAQGQEILSRELGAGAVNGVSTIITLHSVLSAGLEFLASAPHNQIASLRVRVDGRRHLELKVLGTQDGITCRSGVPPLALLVVESSTPLLRRPLAMPEQGEFRIYPPGQGEKTSAIALALDSEHRGASFSRAPFLKLTEASTSLPGLPLYQDGNLIGMTLPSDYGSLALSSKELKCQIHALLGLNTRPLD